MSGDYDDIDSDKGDELIYSMSGARESTFNKIDLSNGSVAALRRSLETHKPVRVLRTENAKWAGRPEAGIRYDGLYEVVQMLEQRNSKGGVYAAFKLTRLGNQPPIDTMQPSKALARQFKRVHRGY